MATTQDNRSGQPGIVGLGWGMYQQVAAVLGAFGLAAMVGDIFGVGWRGFVGTLVGYWGEYVRPVAKAVFNAIVTVPLSWFGWHVEVPLLVRDYLVVGTIFALSMSRELKRIRADVSIWPRLREPVNWPARMPMMLVTWPIMALAFVAGPFIEMEAVTRKEALVNSIMILSPLIYLGLLLAVNYIVL